MDQEKSAALELGSCKGPRELEADIYHPPAFYDIPPCCPIPVILSIGGAGRYSSFYHIVPVERMKRRESDAVLFLSQSISKGKAAFTLG